MTSPLETLDEYHRLVKATILDFQNPVTGLLPASLFRGQFESGRPCCDAWIRDNVYRYVTMCEVIEVLGICLFTSFYLQTYWSTFELIINGDG